MRASATLDHVNSARQSWAGRLSGPTASYLAAFPGFEEIAQESLPDRLSTRRIFALGFRPLDHVDMATPSALEQSYRGKLTA
jgi:hypothetical protein